LSKDLVDLIKKVTWNKPETVPIDTFGEVLANFYADLEDKWGNKISKRDELKEIGEYIEVLGSVLTYLGERDYRENERSMPMRTVKDFLFYLEKKLGGLDPDNEHDAAALKNKDPKTTVMLTTAHKSKGLEWDRIFLMKPSAYNPQGPNIKTEEQAQQEMNAWYVAATRGKKTLMVSADELP
jgi:superfamily I DNA/RNA helicase